MPPAPPATERWSPAPESALRGLSAIAVFREEPDLVADLPPAARRRLTETIRVRGILTGRGEVRIPRSLTGPGTLGLLVLEGFVALEVSAAKRSHVEIVGPGDLLRPWEPLDRHDFVPSSVRATALTSGRLALLDRRFAGDVARWPEVTSALMQRLLGRSRRLGLQLALTAMPRVDDRIALLLWHFADRWGRVTPGGVRLDLPLTHAMLGRCISAQRPSVTTAMSRLRATSRLERTRQGQWVLHGSPPAAAAHPEALLGAPVSA